MYLSCCLLLVDVCCIFSLNCRFPPLIIMVECGNLTVMSAQHMLIVLFSNSHRFKGAALDEICNGLIYYGKIILTFIFLLCDSCLCQPL